MLRRLVIVFAIFFGALSGGIVALTSPRVAENLRDRIIAVARNRFGVELAIAELKVELLPPAIELREVRLADTPQADPWLVFHRGRVMVQPWPSVTGAVVVQQLEVDGLVTDLTELEHRFKPDPDDGKKHDLRKLPVDVLELSLWNARLSRQVPELGNVFADDVQLTMRPRHGAARDVALEIAALELTPNKQPVRTHVTAHATLYGSIDAPQRVAVTNVLLDNPRFEVRGNGQAEFLPLPKLSVHIDTIADLERVLALVPRAPALHGNGRVELDLKYDFTSLTAGLVADVRALSLPRGQRYVELGNVGVKARYAKQRIDVDQLFIDHPTAGKLEGTGNVDLAQGLPVALKAKVQHAVLPEILDLAGLPDAWVRLVFDGGVDLAGTLDPFALTLNVDGLGDDLRVRDRSYRAATGVTYLALDNLGLSGSANVDTKSVRLDGMRIALDQARYSVDGTLSFDPQTGIAVTVASEHADLKDLGSVGGLKMEGEGKLDATIHGPYRDPTIHAQTSLTHLAILGYGIGDVEGGLTYEHPVLAFEDFTVKRHEGSAHGNGTIDFGGKVAYAKADMTVEHVDLSSALTDIGVPKTIADRLNAHVSGTVAVDGPLKTPIGVADLHSSDFAVDKVVMGAATFVGGFDATANPDTELAWGKVAMQPQGGRADGRAAYRKDGTVELQASVAQIPVGIVSPFIGNIPMRGTASGQVHLNGKPGALVGKASARFREWEVYNARLETSRVDAVFTPEKVTLDAELLSGDAEGRGTLLLDGDGTYEVTVDTKRFDFARLMPVTDPFTVTVDGQVIAHGILSNPRSLTTAMNMTRVDVRWRELEMKSVGPVTMAFDNDTLRVQRMKLAGAALELEVAGDAPLDGELDVHVKGSGALTALQRLSPRIQSAEGQLALDFRTRGTWSNVELDGVATVRKGELRVTNVKQALEDVSANMSFSGRTLALDSANATLGGGTVRMEGQVILANDKAHDVAFRTELSRVLLEPQSDLQAMISGILNLQGKTDDLLLSGQLKVDQLRYTQNIELMSLVPEQVARPIQVPAMEPSEVVRLAVQLTAPNNIIVSNNVLEAELRADLTLTGTSARIGLLGNVSPLWARARYRNNVFAVERASIDFTDEYRIFTQFDVRASTRACNIDSRVNIFGDTEHYNVTASGSDLKGPVDQADVLSCLQFGIRLRQFEGHEAAGATTTLRDTYAGGLDALWTVSGMDEKVRQVLPIELDEVRLTSGWSTRARRTTARIQVGKDIGRNFVVRYSHSIEDETDHNVALEYRMSQLATVQGTWLSVTDMPISDFGLDLRLRWELR